MHIPLMQAYPATTNIAYDKELIDLTTTQAFFVDNRVKYCFLLAVLWFQRRKKQEARRKSLWSHRFRI
jgi:hypothetical protein